MRTDDHAEAEAIAELDERLIELLKDAVEIESSMMEVLDRLRTAVRDEQARGLISQHHLQTRHHRQRLIERLEAHGETARRENRLPPAPTLLGSREPRPQASDASLPEDGDGLLLTCAMIAGYDLLEATAVRAGDLQTARVARLNRGDDRRLPQVLQRGLDALESPPGRAS